MIRRARLYALATLLAVVAASCHHNEAAGDTDGRSLVVANTSPRTMPAPRN